MAAARLSMIFAPLDCKRPSRDALKVASNWLLDFCSLPSSRNSLPIVVDTFDILSRNRAVSLKLAETVGYWVTRECALRRIPGRVSFDLLIAFAGVNRRHDELLNLLSKNLSSALVLDTFGEIEICALAGAFARLEYLCVTFMSELLRVVEKRFSDGLSWRTYAVILHAFATLRFRPGEENPLMWSGRLSWLKARDYSGILWACGNLEWEVDERIIRRAVKDLCSANRDVTPIDVYSILMAFAYIERRPEEVAEIVEVAVGKRYVPSGMLARQLAAALAGNREVIGLLGLDSLRVALNLLATYENDKKGTESSGAEHEILEIRLVPPRAVLISFNVFPPRMSLQLHHLLSSFNQLSAALRPTRVVLQNASRALVEFCGAAGNLSNSLAIVVDAFDILSRHRYVDTELGETVGNWLCTNYSGALEPAWIGHTVMVAYAGASLRTQEAVLAWVGQCLMRNGALEDLTIDAICGLTAALAKMDYLNFMVYDKILDEINRRCESLTAKQYAVLLHSMASVGYRRSNALPKIGDLSLLGAREVSSVMWANATLEWKCDEHIEGIGMELCRREEGELTGIDVNNIITALAYGRGISDRKNVFWAIRCSLGRTYRPTPAYARQLSALLAQYPEVLVEFSIRELGRINGALDSYHGAKGEVKSSKMEMTVLESLAKIAHCEGFLIDDNNCDVGWYTVDVVIVNVS